MNRSLTVGLVALGGLALTTLLLWLLAPPTSRVDVPLAATVELRDGTASSTWTSVDVRASGGRQLSVDGAGQWPCHFIIGPDGDVQATERWHTQQSADASFGRTDAICVVLVGSADRLSSEQVEAARQLKAMLTRRYGLMQ